MQAHHFFMGGLPMLFYGDEIGCINDYTYLDQLANDPTAVLCLSSTNRNAMQSVRRMFIELMNRKVFAFNP